MKNYKIFTIILLNIFSVSLIVILLPINLLVEKSIAKIVSISFLVGLLLIALFGWIHFRIELSQIVKRNAIIFSNEEIDFYLVDKSLEDVQKKTRIKKISTFVVFMTTLIILTALISMPILV